MEKWLRISLLPPWPTNKIRVAFGRDAKEAASKAFSGAVFYLKYHLSCSFERKLPNWLFAVRSSFRRRGWDDKRV